MEGSILRKETRLLSSLMDLKLKNGQKIDIAMEQEGRRKKQRNGTIKGFADQEIYQNFTTIEKKKSLIDKTLILKSLSRHFTFSSLMKDKDIQEILLDQFKLCRINKGQYLMKQNDNASSFFILHEGELDVQINGELKRNIQSGQGFGQLALLYSSPRSASIKASKSSFLWYIDRSTFRKAVSSMIEKNFTETRAFIQKNDFFVYLTSSQKDKIASIAIRQKFTKKSKICKEGQLASSMYIVKSGVLKKIVDGIQCGKLTAGQFCEEYATLKKNSLRRDTIIVEEDAQVIAIGVQDIQGVLGKSLPLIITRNKVRAALLEHKQYKNLSPKYLDLALDCFKLKNVLENQEVVKKGQHCRDMIFLAIEGEYSISNQKEQSKIFGSESITSSNHQMTYSFNLKFTSNGKIVWAKKEEILSAFRCTYEQSIEKVIAIEKSMEESEDRLIALKNQCAKYQVSDFQVLQKLGQGQFGTVFLVTDPTRNKYFAMKCISKEQTIKNKLEKHVVNEKKVLQDISSSPFCVTYIRSFKDNNFIYLLTQFINGLELFDVIRIIGLLNVQQTRFYSAIMFYFLETMHSKNIIYRDLKPQNIMVSENGYLKFIDMGTCKQLSSKLGTKKTFTIIGTPNYMAPEIISGKGYSYTADLWSLGIVIYEFMAGYVPFGEDAEDPYEIYQEILKKPLKFPNYMKDAHTNNFIVHLLNKVPEARLGGSYSSLSKHPFFNGIDWEKLIKKTIPAPFTIPKEKLMNLDSCSSKKTKPIGSLLQNKKSLPTRKDLNPKWDECF